MCSELLLNVVNICGVMEWMRFVTDKQTDELEQKIWETYFPKKIYHSKDSSESHKTYKNTKEANTNTIKDK